MPRRLRVSWQNAPDLRPGQYWRISLKIRPVSGMSNPGLFDYQAWLYHKRIDGLATVQKRRPSLLLKEDAGYVNAWRVGLQQWLQNSGATYSGLMQALLIGDRSAVSPEQKSALVATGTLHLLAISGLHIGLVSGFIGALVWRARRLYRPLLHRVPAQIVAAWVGVTGGGIYALLAGFQLPTQRALIMVAVAAWALSSRRRISPFTALGVALLLVLLWDIHAVLDGGFWLSFGAVSILLLLYRQGQSRLYNALYLQMGISILMVPLLAWQFHQVPLLSPLANVLAIPWVAMLLPVLMLSVIISPLTSLGLQLVDHMLGLLMMFLHALASSGWIWQLMLSAGPAFLLFVVLLVLLRFGGAGLRFPALVIALLLIFSPSLNDRPPQGALRISQLDVGQGSGYILETAQHVLVYDTGARYPGGFDIGEQIVLPSLRYRGIDYIDKVLISHSDRDHAGGWPALRHSMRVGELLRSDDKVEALGVPASFCRAGQHWQWDGVDFTVLWPPQPLPASDNDRSCVLQVKSSNGTLVLTGDISRDAEQAIVALYGEHLHSHVLSVPHHGSASSSSPAFVAAVKPEVALLSRALNNRHGHPAPGVMETYRVNNVRVLDSAFCGYVSLESANNWQVQGLPPRPWRNQDCEDLFR